MKVWAAICPLCQQRIPLRGEHEPENTAQDESKMVEHLGTHPLREWAVTVQDLRNQVEGRDQLTRVPRWAMPQA